MKIYIVTSCYAHTDESDDIGEGIDPLTRLDVFTDYAAALARAEALVVEETYEGDKVERNGDRWEITGTYANYFIAIHGFEVSASGEME